VNILQNVASMWRFATQSTLLYSFPLVFPLAIAGFWAAKKERSDVWILAALFTGMVFGHLLQTEPSSSLIGERYWFEAYFCVTILASYFVVRLFRSWRPGRAAAVAIYTMSAAQVLIMLASAGQLNFAAWSGREMRRLAESYEHCGCVVFLQDSNPFHGAYLNLNGPSWPRADVFYAIDPGAPERREWAGGFGGREWGVLRYDRNARRAEVDPNGAAPSSPMQ